MQLSFILPLCSLIFAFLSIICCVLTGKKIDLKDFGSKVAYLLSILPTIVKQCETIKGSELKKETAVATAMSFVQDKFGSLSDAEHKKLTKYTSEKIEEILSTPTKKVSNKEVI